MEQLEEPIHRLKKEVQELAESNEKASRLITVPGIGAMTRDSRRFWF